MQKGPEVSSANGNSRYKWNVLAIAALTHTFAVAMPRICIPVLFQEISGDLGLSLVERGWIWGIVALGGILTVLPGGLLGDRFGVKRVLVVACFLGGIAGALRGTSDDFGCA